MLSFGAYSSYDACRTCTGAAAGATDGFDLAGGAPAPAAARTPREKLRRTRGGLRHRRQRFCRAPASGRAEVILGRQRISCDSYRGRGTPLPVEGRMRRQPHLGPAGSAALPPDTARERFVTSCPRRPAGARAPASRRAHDGNPTRNVRGFVEQDTSEGWAAQNRRRIAGYSGRLAATGCPRARNDHVPNATMARAISYRPSARAGAARTARGGGAPHAVARMEVGRL
jgi:hypothetical protein